MENCRLRICRLEFSPESSSFHINTRTNWSIWPFRVSCFISQVYFLLFLLNMRSFRVSFAILLTCACTLRQTLMPEVSAQEQNDVQRTSDECQVTPVIHVLQYPGCVPKPIPSFACIGRCESYIQVSGSKIWQLERSCMCCQVRKFVQPFYKHK